MPDSERAKNLQTVAVGNVDERRVAFQQTIEETRRGGHEFIRQGAYFGFVEHLVRVVSCCLLQVSVKPSLNCLAV